MKKTIYLPLPDWDRVNIYENLGGRQSYQFPLWLSPCNIHPPPEVARFSKEGKNRNNLYLYAIALESRKKLIRSQLNIWKSEKSLGQKCQYTPHPEPRLILVATGNQDHICGLRVDSWSPLITMESKSFWNHICFFFLSRKENSNAISEYCVFISRILGGGDWCCVHYVMCEKLRRLLKEVIPPVLSKVRRHRD